MGPSVRATRTHVRMRFVMGEAHHKKTCEFVFEPSWATTREPTVGSSEEGASVYTTEESKGVEKVEFFAFSTPQALLLCCRGAGLRGRVLDVLVEPVQPLGEHVEQRFA